jgi:ubiquitin related modifier 1
MDSLFGNQKEVDASIDISESSEVTVLDVMMWARDNLLTDRPELFMKADSVRPGVLVLVNDVDWELSGTTKAPVVDGDTVTFISTLHGG